MLFSLSTECMEAAQKKRDRCCSASQSLHIFFSKGNTIITVKYKEKQAADSVKAWVVFIVNRWPLRKHLQCVYTQQPPQQLWHRTLCLIHVTLISFSSSRADSSNQFPAVNPTTCSLSAMNQRVQTDMQYTHVHIDTQRCRPPRALHVNRCSCMYLSRTYVD